MEEDGSCQALDNMRRGINILVFLALALIVLSCSETKEISPEDTGINYFPLEVGNYAIYHVEGVEYINTVDSVPFSYELKETVVDSFQNLELGISYKLLREVRENESDLWKTDSVWTSRKDNIRAIRMENNVSFICLVFPIKENKTWDVNGYNDQDIDEYEMIDVRKPFNGSFDSFGESLTVVQEDIPDKVVNFISRKEVYSKDVGLVYKENIKLDWAQGDLINKEIIESGIKYYQSIIEYGQE